MAGNAGSLGLNSLRPTNLQTLGGCVGIQGHVLRLKRSRLVTVLTEDATEGCGDNALSDIATRSGKHDGVESIHIGYRCV